MEHSSTASKAQHHKQPTDCLDVEVPTSPSDASIPTGPLDALEHSPFRRLPAELRREIFAIALKQEDGLVFAASSWQCSRDGTPAAKLLNLRATCRQIYRETEGLFFGINDIHLNHLNVVGSKARRMRMTELALRSLEKICKLPSLLPTETLPRIIVWPVMNDSNWTELDCSLTIRIVTAARELRPFRLFVGCQISRLSSHRFASPSNPDSGIAGRKLCIRDASMSMSECVHVELVFPVDDQAAAFRSIDEACQSKLVMLELHRQHRMCPIRVELDSIRASLETACQTLRSRVLTTTAAWSDSTGALDG